MAVQFLDIGGKKMAVLPVSDYEDLVEFAESKNEVLAAIHAEKRRNEGEEYLPSDMVDRLIAGESALKLWRKHRGMTLAELGSKSGVGRSFLSEIENGNRMGKATLWRKLSVALNVDMEDIVPDSED